MTSLKASEPRFRSIIRLRSQLVVLYNKTVQSHTFETYWVDRNGMNVHIRTKAKGGKKIVARSFAVPVIIRERLLSCNIIIFLRCTVSKFLSSSDSSSYCSYLISVLSGFINERSSSPWHFIFNAQSKMKSSSANCFKMTHSYTKKVYANWLLL